MNFWLIVNGKGVGNPELREAVDRIREEGVNLSVRVTWESGDIARFLAEAVEQKLDRIIVAGGDGTLHEATNALMSIDAAIRPALGIIPMGTANDFATATEIPEPPLDALSLAVHGTPRAIDVARINDLYFLNMASGGFGAKVTSDTPPALKKLLGGGAYSLVGIMQAWRFEPFRCQLQTSDGNYERDLIVLAIGNGCQAGGGQELTPRALLNDGLLDVLTVEAFSLGAVGSAIQELRELPTDGKLVRYHQLTSMDFQSKTPLPINLDGEFHEFTQARVEVCPGALSIVLPDECRLMYTGKPRSRHGRSS
ncbi:putative lipid kinase YegS-like protein [Kushneria pakistanensis]|uniref:Probable lipid kinase YegS-like n=1 Tax=Kushneria pakistanensis TaxID=1508770 RepID=A0ABQ3FCN7_9GAMM|nr:lipid kinase YegS [Kushneria pakistanensis]GHC18289.1 putative lipid kinase YegS-like protein [Kushneria pakistanensis]